MNGLSRLRVVLGLVLAASLLGASAPAEEPLTVAEASQYKSTSRLADVMAFIAALQQKTPLLRVETLCRSAEGRDVPLLILADPPVSSPLDLRRGGRAVVYIQANIHAGEVEGKEASLMLARDILLSAKPPYLDRLVILIAPVFNADGNEKISPNNRRNQAGPENGVGVRHNGQNLDLNRDGMKLESPELRGVVQNVLLRWDPVLAVDCHTTNGSYHEEPVTLTWAPVPNSDPEVLRYQRDKLMPAVEARIEKTFNIQAIPYGDPRDFRDLEKGWETFGHQPRFFANYVGLRNRLSILNENYVYADFKTRVEGCYALLDSLLDYCHAHTQEILKLVADADGRSVRRGINPNEGDQFGLEFELKAVPEKVTIQTWEVEVIPREGTYPEIKKTDRKKTYTIPYFAEYAAKRSVRFPAGYLIAVPDEVVTAKLIQHGIIVERLVTPAKAEVEVFRPKELKGEERLYQGHRTNKVKGEYTTETKEFPAGTIFVSTAQPLGSLAAGLLEPESDDGLLAWNFFDKYLVPQWGRGLEAFPVYRLLKPQSLAKEIVR